MKPRFTSICAGRPWSGRSSDTRDLQVIRTGDRWAVAWPIVKEPRVPPQVIPVNYLRWDVIYRGAEDDWGAQDVESPHVRIVDMHPVDRGGGVVILGEVLNEDVVPAFVTVKATLLAKDGSAIATEDSFDKISHILLPRQVTPFLIDVSRCSAVPGRQRSHGAVGNPHRCLGGPGDRDRRSAAEPGARSLIHREARQSKRPGRQRGARPWDVL